MQIIAAEHVDEAEKILGDFLDKFVELYGRDSQTFNFHSLRHLCDQVRRKGPLSRNSVFGFESANSFLLKAVKGTKTKLFVSTKVPHRHM